MIKLADDAPADTRLRAGNRICVTSPDYVTPRSREPVRVSN